MMRKTVAVVLLMLGVASGAFASLGSVGPTHPVNGFPIWYTDGNGLKLDLCLDPAYCVFGPPIPGNPFSEEIGFGDEAFWWNAEAALTIVGSGEGLLVLGLEAAFLNGEPVDGEQVVFARIRIRADLPIAGTYTVTHPFGSDVFNVTDPGQDAIKYTEDVGGTVVGDFTTALGSRIGPFLVAVNPPPPPGFVGNFNVLQTVTGSPLGTNVFRIDGPPGSNLDGNGHDFVTTSLFNLQGRVYPCLPVDVAPASLPGAVRGDPYAATLSASGGAGPYVFSVTSGALPPGLSLAASGVLSGTPTASGSYTFTATAIDQNLCTGSRSYTINVACGVVVILPPTLPDASQGLPYSQQLTAPGSGPWTFSVSAGALPAGLTLSGAGLLSGTPMTFGDSSFTVTATDPNSCTGSRVYSVHVGCGNVGVSPPVLPSGVQGTPYGQMLTAAGGTAPYAFALVAGALPAGLSLAPNGALSGTPTLPGTFNFTISATDVNGCAGARAYSVTIACPSIAVLPATLPSAQQNAPYNQALLATGGTGPYAFAVTAGALPPGLALAPGGQLAGSPTLPGSFTFTVTATDANGCGGSRAYSLVVDCDSIGVSPATLPDGVRGDPYAATLSAAGGTGPYAFTITSGALPPGLSLATNGALSGTPSAAGAYTFTVTATDVNLCTGSRSYTIDVACGVVVILPPILPDASQGLPYSQQLTAPGSGTWTFSVSAGALPAGLTLSSAGLLSGTPTSFGDSAFTVTATDPSSCSGSRAYSLHVGCGNVAVSPLALPPGTPGVPYAQTLTAAGGTPPYAFAVTQGALPPGLVLAGNGTLSGTPQTLGTFDFTVTATDPNGCPGTRDYSLLIRDPMLSIGDASVVEGDAGTTDASFTVSLSDAIAASVTVDYATAGLSATAGVDFVSASGSLTFLPPGTTPQSIHVAVLGDTSFELDEGFTVTLSGPTGAVIDDGEGLGTIVNDDPLTAFGTTRELGHGSELWRQLGALPGGVPRDDWFRVAQRAHASYEVSADGTTGDIGDEGPRLERVASDGATIVQDSTPAGASGSRSLRWENASGGDVNDQFVRLRSAGCSSDCTPEDGCRIRLFVTTAGVARFNNSSSQSTVLVLQNTGDEPVSGHAWFWSGAGSLIGAHAFALAPRAALVLPTGSVAGVGGASGSITVSHDGGFGQLAGKAVALEPATGFSFDTPLVSRPR